MPERVISQRTIVQVKRVLAGLTERGVDFRDLFYESGFPDWFIRQVNERYARNWIEVFWSLRSGAFFYHPTGHFDDEEYTIVPNGPLSHFEATELGEQFIRKLAAFAFVRLHQVPPMYSALAESLPRSLQLDGFDVDRANMKLVLLEGPVSAQEEEDRSTRLVKSSGLPDNHIILKHIQDAASLYAEAKDQPSLGQSRNILQALIDGISTETNRHGGHSLGLPSGTGPRIGYLKDVQFFTGDEQAAFKSAWGSLSAGAHPGVPEREQARIGLILALEFGQLLLMKFGNWKNNGYKAFK
jgi:hypothetical protein